MSGLRLAAQERAQSEFQHILSEVDAYIFFNPESAVAPTAITSNLQQITLPEALYVAELTIDDKAMIMQAKTKLSYGGKARSRKSVVKMELLLNSVETDGWVCHDNKLLSFQDIEQCDLISVIDEGSVERLGVSNLVGSAELDNVNILKQLLSAETREQLERRHVRMYAKDWFFFFGTTEGARWSVRRPRSARRPQSAASMRSNTGAGIRPRSSTTSICRSTSRSRSWGTPGMRRRAHSRSPPCIKPKIDKFTYHN